MRVFFFNHGIRVPGLDYAGLTPKPSPLTAQEQKMAQRLTDNFFAVLSGSDQAIFAHDSASRAAREYAKVAGITLKTTITGTLKEQL
jgi:hypothetical protein